MSLDLSLLPPNEQHKCQRNNPFMESWSSKKKNSIAETHVAISLHAGSNKTHTL